MLRAINFKRLLGLVLFVVLTCLVAVNASDFLPIPKVNYVTDQNHYLTREQYVNLAQKLANFEKEVGSQIAVIIVPTLKGENIDDFGFRVADSWKLGRKGVGDGLLIIVVPEERKARIEVMRDLEGAIPDAVAGRILTENFFPNFAERKYYAGLNSGLDRIFDHIRMEGLPPPGSEGKVSSKHRAHSSESLLDEPWAAIFFIGLVFTMMLRQILGRKSAPLAGICVGGLAWYVFQSVVAGIVIALLVVAIGMLIPTSVLKAGARRTAHMYRDRRYHGGFGGGFGGFGGGFGDGSGVGGGGVGGGSGSGGGGSAGGGGASGSW